MIGNVNKRHYDINDINDINIETSRFILFTSEITEKMVKP